MQLSKNEWWNNGWHRQQDHSLTHDDIGVSCPLYPLLLSFHEISSCISNNPDLEYSRPFSPRFPMKDVVEVQIRECIGIPANISSVLLALNVGPTQQMSRPHGVDVAGDERIALFSQTLKLANVSHPHSRRFPNQFSLSGECR